MEIIAKTSQHLVKSEDLNHHGTLFAGKGAELIIAAGFIAAATITSPNSVVCHNVHELKYTRPVRLGTIITIEAKVVLTGNTRMIVYVKMTDAMNGDRYADAFITFVHIDEKGKSKPHGLEITAVDEEDRLLQVQAQKFLAATN